MSRTELQYNLQKARALATELRSVLEAIEGDNDPAFLAWTHDESPSDYISYVEAWLDDDAPCGKGWVGLTCEPFGGAS